MTLLQILPSLDGTVFQLIFDLVQAPATSRCASSIRSNDRFEPKLEVEIDKGNSC